MQTVTGYQKCVSKLQASLARSEKGCIVLHSFEDPETGQTVMLTLSLEALKSGALAVIGFDPDDITLTPVVVEYDANGHKVTGA